MKKIFSIIIALVVIFSVACAQTKNKDNENKSELNWYTNLEEAKEISTEKKIPILVDFTGSDWCGWCVKLRDEVFSKEDFIQYAKENLVLVELDFPRKTKQSNETKAYNNNLAQKYGIRGFPTILLLNSDGGVIAKTGFQHGGAKNYVTHLNELLSIKSKSEL